MKKFFSFILFVFLFSCSEDNQSILKPEQSEPTQNGPGQNIVGPLNKVTTDFYFTRVYGRVDFDYFLGEQFSIGSFPEDLEEGDDGLYTTDIIPQSIKSGEIQNEGTYYVNNDYQYTYQFMYWQFVKDYGDQDIIVTDSDRQVSSTKKWFVTSSEDSIYAYPDKYGIIMYIKNITYMPDIPTVSISGPLSCAEGYTVRYYASAKGRNTPFYYKWWIKEVPESTIPQRSISTRAAPPNVWVELTGGIDNVYQNYTAKDDRDFYIKCVVTDNNGNEVTSNVIFCDVEEDIPQ